jgi:RNA polymerase sigma-70 factor, ECF subfamily
MGRRSDASDADLVRALSTRQRRAAATELFDRYWDECWSVALGITGSRELAEDIAQEALLRLFRRPEAWDESRPLRPWLRRIGANLALDALRQRRRFPVSSLDGDGADLADDEEWLSDIDTDTIVELRRLTPEHRVILLLRYWGDFSIAEIAELLAIPVGTVMSRSARALAQLRRELEKHHA